MDYSGDDILIIVGDLVDKGPESLRVVRYVMDLCRQHPVYVTMGNVDLGRLECLFDDSPDAGQQFVDFLNWLNKFWKNSFFEEMLSELGISINQVNLENAEEYRGKMQEQFKEELDFLWSRPTILTAGDYLFVHGGVPTDEIEELEQTPAAQYLKNDDFLNQGYRFEKYTVVTGHWPTCLYREDVEDVSPLFNSDRRIICIDGGCGLKMAGQLNGIILPDRKASIEEINWTSYDDFPFAIAEESQEEKKAEIHIRFFDSAVELLEEKGEMGSFKQISTGKVFEGPLEWMKRWDDGRFHFDDYCDRQLPVKAGEMLSVLFKGDNGYYVKNCRGELGWYFGRMTWQEPEKN